MRKTILSQAILFALSGALLAGCGGGGGGSGGSTAGGLTLRGQVSDGPIGGAKVCLQNFPDICTTADDQGNYTLTIPGNLVKDDTRLTLVATKAHGGQAEGIKLISFLGTMGEIKGLAKTAEEVDQEQLPGLVISHITTARFAVMDEDNDGIIDDDELEDPGFEKIQDLAMLIKAVIHYNYLPEDFTNTLELVEEHENDNNISTEVRSGIGGDDYKKLEEDITGDINDSNFLKMYLTNATLVDRGQGAGYNSQDAVIVHFNGDGTGEVYDYDSGGPQKTTISWRIKDGQTVTITENKTDMDVKVSIHGNVIQITDEDGDSTFYRAQPFTKEDISGKQFEPALEPGRTFIFNSDGSGTEKPADCNSNGVNFAWKIENGALVLDESASCMGETIRVFKAFYSGGEYPGYGIVGYVTKGGNITEIFSDFVTQK